MATPARFHFFTRRATATGVEWRLVMGNNRELGRASAPYTDLAACTDAVRRLQTGLPHLAASLVAGTPGRWSWNLRDEADGVLAVSGRDYCRRVEVQSALEKFRAAAGAAHIIDEVRAVGFLR
ncbi:hypothetical protein EV189_1633 [Motilibacter rhizosphaerae]|uniref:DUF1508 domain-containing protein n=1 Tax=Motilibacter rhizosphaerae TaxID=598652 RepID=A0A4Q7NRZ6_9ACTN|nr:hypothetical protein [Motilibacter rhizosphaerae]RZS89857.1 hypothetical protein EV189_1633 [Motilibacter rhizosphaerae]